ncbi:hypothetical protein HDU99_005788 [Rhizoclosmatium hyalinum]|nr:hypothetical protein HDU99_005788 [Rhizoclosmatium hyalinum]
MSAGPESVAAVYPLVSQGTVYGVGETNALSWTNNVTASADIVNVRLDLGTGSATSVTTLYSVVTLPWPATSCYEWTPAADLSTTAQYTFTFQGLDKNNKTISTNYVTWFNIAAPGSAGYPAATKCGASVPVPVPAPAPIPATASAPAAAAVTTTKSNGFISSFSLVASAIASFALF